MVFTCPGYKKTKFPLALIFCVFLFPITVPVDSLSQQMAAGCHCFKDRSYDPARKFAADPYILATSFNSMLAAHFNISKRQIIMMRMQGGVDGDDLTTSLYLGKVMHTDFESLLSLRAEGQSWAQIINKKQAEIPGEDPVRAAAGENADNKRINETAVTEMVSGYFGIPSEAIQNYRSKGLSDKEIVLSLGLSFKSGRPVDDLIALQREEGQSWGEIANSLGIAAADIGGIISQAKRSG